MTEYDYSEEAYHRHLDTQSRISNWVHKTHRVPQASPDTPPTPATAPRPLYRDDDRDRDRDRDRKHHRRARSSHRTVHEPDLQRPRTAPPRGDVYGVQAPVIPIPLPEVPKPRYPAGYPRAPTPYYPVPPAAPPPLPPQHRRTRSSSQAPEPHRRPSHDSRTRSQSYLPAPGPMFAPAPPLPPLRSNTYAGNNSNMRFAPPQAPVYASPYPTSPVYSSARSPSPMRSPTREREVPLLKRVFSGWGKGSGSGKGSSGGRSPRRGDTY